MPVRRRQAGVRQMPGALLPETTAGTGARDNEIRRAENAVAPSVASLDARMRQVPQGTPPDGIEGQPETFFEVAAHLIRLRRGNHARWMRFQRLRSEQKRALSQPSRHLRRQATGDCIPGRSRSGDHFSSAFCLIMIALKNASESVQNESDVAAETDHVVYPPAAPPLGGD